MRITDRFSGQTLQPPQPLWISSCCQRDFDAMLIVTDRHHPATGAGAVGGGGGVGGRGGGGGGTDYFGASVGVADSIGERMIRAECV